MRQEPDKPSAVRRPAVGLQHAAARPPSTTVTLAFAGPGDALRIGAGDVRERGAHDAAVADHEPRAAGGDQLVDGAADARLSSSHDSPSGARSGPPRQAGSESGRELARAAVPAHSPTSISRQRASGRASG